jgi:hypothetical protein
MGMNICAVSEQFAVQTAWPPELDDSHPIAAIGKMTKHERRKRFIPSFCRGGSAVQE